MSDEKRVIRFEPYGPVGAGLQAMELDQADFQSELPEQQLHVYFEDEALGLSAGVWTTTDMQEAFGPYPGDEFMCLLEGQVDMIDGEGNATRIKQGQAFCVRNGIPTSWKQVGFLRKFYMTYENPAEDTRSIDSAQGGVVVLDPEVLQQSMELMDTTDPFVITGEAPRQHDAMAFTNDEDNMFMGMWDSTAFESEMRPFPCHEFVQLLEGEIAITQGDGMTHRFAAGDVFLVPEGTLCSWKTSGYVKKLYCIFDPSV
jgi:hypothetical protein